MRVRMRHRSMLVGMHVVLPPIPVEAVFMLMVFVVNVFVGVLQQRIEDALRHIKLPVLRTPAKKIRCRASARNTAVAVRKLLLRPPRRDMILEFMPEQLKLRTELAMQLVGAVTDLIKATARGRPCRPEFPNDHMAARFHSTLDLYGFRSSWKL